MSVIDTNTQTFNDDVLSVKDIPVIVDFWAPWCGPCKMQGPILDELAAEIDDKTAIIAKVNVDENFDLAGQYGIMSIPALKIFKNGKLVDEMMGVHQKDQLKAVIAKHSK